MGAQGEGQVSRENPAAAALLEREQMGGMEQELYPCLWCPREVKHRSHHYK